MFDLNYYGDYVQKAHGKIANIRAFENLVRQDFTKGLVSFLKTHFSLKYPAGLAVANLLYEKMNVPNLHYHTPIHVLSLFQFYYDHFETPLNPEEELALWFHDSVYLPGSITNESDSVMFMHTVLGLFISDPKEMDIITKAGVVILDTAKHLKGEIGLESELVLDLDLSSFAYSYEQFKEVGDMVRREFYTISDEDFLAGRRKFMQQMLEKGFIYRTKSMVQLFEQKAQENIEKFLAETA